MAFAWDESLYYNPEKHGLQTVTEADAGGGYDFDKFMVWRDKKDLYYWGDDSGCSCPSPFENIGSLSELGSGTAAEALGALNRWKTEEAWNKDERVKASTGATDTLRDLVRRQTSSVGKS